MKYALKITRASNSNADGLHAVTDVRTGSLALVSFAAKEAKAELDNGSDTDFRVELDELDSEGNHSRALLALTGDGDTIGAVLKTRLAKVRKQAAATEPAPPRQDRDEDPEWLKDNGSL